MDGSKTGITVGEKPVVTMDVSDGKVRLAWKTSLFSKTLDFLIDKCVGCGLCLYCPWDAIEIGPVAETAAGRIEGAPLIDIDPEACTFCGLCDSACIFRALVAHFEGQAAVNHFNRIDGTHAIDSEKCAPCLLCAKVCPTHALKAEVHVQRKKDLVVYEGEQYAKGSITVREDKCSFCGLCEMLCPEALKVLWSESAEPPDFKPATAIRVNEDECDYCGLCAKICPDEAIEVKCTESSPRHIAEPEISGKLEHDNGVCVKCGICAEVCPFEALQVSRPFSGDVVVKNLDKCDPIGCNNCFNICPVKAIYPTKKADKIAVLDEHCVYCGACEHACPYGVLEVRREGYLIEELEQARQWEQGRSLFFNNVVGRERTPNGLFERNIVVQTGQTRFTHTIKDKAWKSIDGNRRNAMRTAGRLGKLLRENPRLQMQLERGQVDKVVERIRKREGRSKK